MLTRIIGYSEISNLKDIIKTDALGSIPEGYESYVAVCKAFDILPIKPGEAFDGTKEINYNEVAFSLYKALPYVK